MIIWGEKAEQLIKDIRRIVVMLCEDGRESLVAEVRRLKDTLAAIDTDNVPALTAEVVKLKTELSDLKIQHSQKSEAFDKREREIQHLVGLERKRQEMELAAARREATLTVREQNLEHEREELARQLKFNTERFEKMEAYLKGAFESVLGRLPDVNVELQGKLGGRK